MESVLKSRTADPTRSRPSPSALVWLVRAIALLAFVGASLGILALQRLAGQQNRILGTLGQLELESIVAAQAHLRSINADSGWRPSDDDLAALERPANAVETLDAVAPETLVAKVRVPAETFVDRLAEGQALVRTGDFAGATAQAKELDSALSSYVNALEAAISDANVASERVRSQVEAGSSVLALLALGAVGVLVSQASRLRERARRAEDRNEETEGFFTLVRDATDLVTLVKPSGDIAFQNHAAASFLGLEPDDTVGQPLHRLIHPDDRHDVEARIDESHSGAITDIECRWLHADGSSRMGHTTIRNLLHDDRVEALVLTTRDTTKRYELEEELRAVVETSPLAIVELEIDGNVRRWNGAAERLYGWTSSEVIGATPPHIPDDAADDNLAELRERVLNGDVITGLQVTRRTRDGEDLQVLLSMVARHDGAGNPVGLISFHVDATERHKLEERLRHQAFHDSLTGLANRELFTNRVELALAQASRRGLPVAALFLDLDDFKTVNDSLGHDAGDELLKAVAERISRRVRRSDTAARLGGDEFAVLLVDLQDGASDAEAVARAILDEFRQPVMLGDKEWLIRGSLGIAVGTGEETAAELLRNADVAMYEAKHSGKGQVRRFEPAMFEEAMRRLDQKSVLRRAVTEGNIIVHFQPVVRIEDAQPVGVEALVRWDRPGLEMVRPDELLPLAAELGLSAMLGREVMRQACRAASRLDLVTDADRPKGWVAVNASAEHLLGDEFYDDVLAALTEVSLSPDRLVVEITELPLLRDHDRTIAVLSRLKALGVRIAFDDFGSGYSSLGHVQTAPIQIIKLDRSFVSSRDERRMESALARLIIQLGSTLNLTTVAEGVETPKEAAILHRLGCELAQGYLYCQPVDLQSLLRWWGDSAFWSPLAQPLTPARRLSSELYLDPEFLGGSAEPRDHVGVVGDASDPSVLLGLPFR